MKLDDVDHVNTDKQLIYEPGWYYWLYPIGRSFPETDILLIYRHVYIPTFN